MNELPHKITRICWNSNHWNTPSGALGKSKSLDAFENQAGFGFEEWNFDLSKVIDGYIYAYVPAAGADRAHAAQLSSPFHLSFYSIQNHKSPQRYWIGTVYNVEYVSPTQSKHIYLHYQHKGWLKERFQQLKHLGIDYQAYQDDFPHCFFNIRYKVKDINLLKEPIAFSHNDPAIKSNYYNFLNFSQLPKSVTPSHDFTPQKEYVERESYSIEAAHFKKLHAIVHNQLAQQLKKECPQDTIVSEFMLPNYTRVDLYRISPNSKITLYEIKIARNLRDVLRQAIGQLLEYQFHLRQPIHALVIVSIFDLNAAHHHQEHEFLTFLQQQLNLSIQYQMIELQ